ncbi:MAG: YgiQ family radical SAM protein [Spirochaetales bacterium]|nr:YgiQ family radical SAM protein [Spirochaetales bacterium]
MSINQKGTEKKFIPISKKDLKSRGWAACDFIIVSGDAYVDHPSFGTALIARLLEAEGYRVGIIAQPDWKNPDAFQTLGRPELAFLITSGNIDSMVNHYSTTKKRRRTDSYSPGGQMGLRPDRALIPYTAAARQAYKGVTVILGGVEASLRRLSHYDYWSNKLRRSVLIDSKADLLVYGMGESPIIEIAAALAGGKDIKELKNIRGTVYRTGEKEPGDIPGRLDLPSYNEILGDKKQFAVSFLSRYKNTNPFSAVVLVEKTDNQWVVQNPPALPLTEAQLDRSYEFPYLRQVHPVYEKDGGVPALKEVEFSLTVNRGCFGSCSFCSLTFHQGRIIQPRSQASVVGEARLFLENPAFKGIIHDVGGPTANFFHAACRKQKTAGSCEHRDCLFPEPCPNLDLDHRGYLELLRELRGIEGVKRVFIRSGIRFDYLMAAVEKGCGSGGGEFLSELCAHHVSGQLKTAPEHVSKKVLNLMRKPDNRVYRRFEEAFKSENRKLDKKQYMIPYLISGHPGSGLEEAIELALYLKKQGFIPDQVQDFYPTPSTLSTCIYYTGIDPFTGKEVYSAREPEDKAMQRALLHFHKPENRKMVIKALTKAGRTDLIGRGKNTLVK